MTDPDPVAALAAQLEELRGQLARSQGEVGHLHARLEEFAGNDLVTPTTIKNLGEKLDEAIARLQASDPPAPLLARASMTRNEPAGWPSFGIGSTGSPASSIPGTCPGSRTAGQATRRRSGNSPT